MNIRFIDFRLPRIDVGKTLKLTALLIVILVIATLVSSFFVGFFTSISSNIQVAGFNNITFDPLITIAYILLYYFITLFFQPQPRPQLYLFLFTLFLSFTIPFIQGSVFLITTYFLLRKFNLI